MYLQRIYQRFLSKIIDIEAISGTQLFTSILCFSPSPSFSTFFGLLLTSFFNNFRIVISTLDISPVKILYLFPTTCNKFNRHFHSSLQNPKTKYTDTILSSHILFFVFTVYIIQFFRVIVITQSKYIVGRGRSVLVGKCF